MGVTNVYAPYGVQFYRTENMGGGVALETGSTLSNTAYFIGEPVRTTQTNYFAAASQTAPISSGGPYPDVWAPPISPTLVKSASNSYSKGAYIWGICMEAVGAYAGNVENISVLPALADYVYTAQVITKQNVTQGLVGQYAGLIVGSVASSTGLALTKSTAASTAQTSYYASQFVIVGLNPRSKWGTYAELLVTIKHSQYMGQTT
jgi:hypothetical protein